MLKLKPSTKRHYFELDCSVQELTNIPQLRGKCYMVISLSDSPLKEKTSSRKVLFREKSDKVDIKDHRCVWNYKISGLQFKLYEDGKTGLVTDKWLTVKFISENESKDKNVLGMLSINLSEYLNETKPVTNRFLLQDSKVNSICKMTLFINSEVDRPTGGYKISSSTGGENSTPIPRTAANAISTSMPSRSSSMNKHNRSSSVESGLRSSPSVRSSYKSGIPPPTVQSSTSPPKNSIGSALSLQPIVSNNSGSSTPSGHRTPTQGSTIWNMTSNVTSPVAGPVSGSNALLNDFAIDSLSNNPTLNKFINKTFQFTWQDDKGLAYTEFTPAECVEDIILNNGTGWKRDDEGIPYIDRLTIEEMPHRKPFMRKGGVMGSNERNYRNLFTNTTSGPFDDYDEGEDDELEDEEEDDNDQDDDEEEVIKNSSNEFHGLKANKKDTKCRLWVSPYSELEVRDDLKSWHVSNIDESKFSKPTVSESKA